MRFAFPHHSVYLFMHGFETDAIPYQMGPPRPVVRPQTFGKASDSEYCGSPHHRKTGLKTRGIITTGMRATLRTTLVVALLADAADAAWSVSGIVDSLKSVIGLGDAVALPDQHTCTWDAHQAGSCADSSVYSAEVLVNGESGDGVMVQVNLAQQEVYSAFKTFDGIGTFFAAQVNETGKLLLPHMTEGYGAPWRVYKANGVRVLKAGDLAPIDGNVMRVYVVPHGLQWMWPSNEIGSSVVVPHVKTSTGADVVLTTASISPRVFEIDGFLTDAEVEEIIAEASAITDDSNGMMRSTTGHNGEVSSMRTSDNAWLNSQTVNTVVKKRAFELLRMHTKHSKADSTSSFYDELADGIQVLRYNVTNGYREHHDYFPIGSDDSNHNYDPTRHGSNRYATIFLYLSDVELGGQTAFPKATREPTEESQAALALAEELFTEKHQWEEDAVRKCFASYATKPRKSSAILFYSQTPIGEMDPMSLHTGCPVLKGKKWAANLWVWNADRASQSIVRGARASSHDGIHVSFHNAMDVVMHAYWQPNAGSRKGLVHQGCV